MALLDPVSALSRFEAARSEFEIPPDAPVTALEKRWIEQLQPGEIEGRDPPLPDPVPVKFLAPDFVPEQKLVWVAEFNRSFQFWELALDENGSFVRLRKSR